MPTPITKSIVTGKAKQYPSWYTTNKIKGVFEPLYGNSPPAWGFDCVGLIKAVLWGWEGNTAKSYGGAVYASNGVPDVTADTMISKCSDVSTDFNNISIGEFLWMKGHCGIYIGDGLAVESTPAWKNGVQITACNCTKKGYNSRYWNKHGKLPYIIYRKGGNDTVSIELTVLRRGSKGKQVKTLQRLLNSFGHNLDVDGSFGSLTESTLKAYQKKYNLTIDGVCGGQTWKSLLK